MKGGGEEMTKEQILSPKILHILVLANQRTNYEKLFRECRIAVHGIIYKVTASHCTWDDLRLTSFGDNGGLQVSSASR